MRKLGRNVQSRVWVGEGLSEKFEVKVDVHQGSVLNPLLFIIVLEFQTGVPWEDLYADDLVIIADSLKECIRKLLIWKESMERKGVRVNAGKTKIMICCVGLDLLQGSGKFPCAICSTGVGRTCNYYACKDRMEEVQGTAACFFRLATSPARPVVMCTAHAYGTQCSMRARLGP